MQLVFLKVQRKLESKKMQEKMRGHSSEQSAVAALKGMLNIDDAIGGG